MVFLSVRSVLDLGEEIFMDSYMELLNEKQREAVLATEGYVRVIAGAGSGKTKLLVSRYAYLVKNYGIDPVNVLCVTFTNKAAGEMKHRIRKLIGEEYDTSLICTYHGFCNRVIRENPERLFLNHQFQIIDNHQQKAVVSEIYQKHELKLDYASFEDFLKKISYYKSVNRDYVFKMCSPDKCTIIEDSQGLEPKFVELMEEYLQRQKATYSLDFGDLIYFAIHLLKENEDVRKKWQERLNYIMVDEFQDSSKVEMELIDILSDSYKNLLIVGDPDQNIYEWRGSDVELLVDFDESHEGTNTIFLNRNYRSTPEILKCANTLIENNEFRLKKDLYTQNPSGASVVHYHSKNENDEMDKIIKAIKTVKEKENWEFSDFAILYRSGFLSRVVEKKLAEKNIPYEIYGGVKFFQRMEVQDILAYLRLISFDDDVSLRRIINTPRRRFGRYKMNLLENLHDNVTDNPFYQGSIWGLDIDSERGDIKQENGESLFQTLERNLDNQEFKNSDVSSLVHFVNGIRKDIGKMRISEIVNRVSAESGYEKYIRELGDQERLDNLSELKRIANEYEREFGENLSLSEFLSQISLQSNEGDEGGRDTVKLMTIHSAKGLEFPAVFIVGFTEGIFPSSKTIEERKQKGLEEERRLCYVAITRAEKYLFLTDSEGTDANGKSKVYSRFLDEIGEENYTRVGYISEDLKRNSLAYRKKMDTGMDDTINIREVFKTGDRVVHHIFGEGTVVSFDNKRRNYSILFDKLDSIRNISESYFEKEHTDIRTLYNNISEETVPIKSVDMTPKEGTIKLEEKEKYEVVEYKEPIRNAQYPELPIKEKAALPVVLPITQEKEERWTEYERYEIDGKTAKRKFEENQQSSMTMSSSSSTSNSSPSEGQITRAQQDALQKMIDNSPNLWNDPNVPKIGWHCVGVTDLGAPIGICEMCGYQIIRYAHYMSHPQYGGLTCGCVCAGKMEGNISAAKRREAELKNKESRKTTFMNKQWKKSVKGNEYLKKDGHLIVLFCSSERHLWKYSIDNIICKEMFATREAAVAAAFEALEKLRGM